MSDAETIRKLRTIIELYQSQCGCEPQFVCLPCRKARELGFVPGSGEAKQ